MTDNSAMVPDMSAGRNFIARVRRWRTQTISVTASRSHSASRAKPNFTMRLRTWHKRTGLFAFIFMGWLGASGFLINQSADWGYDTLRVDWSWVMSLYGLHPEPPRSGYFAGEHWLAATPEATVLDGQALPDTVPQPVGLALGGTEAQPLLFLAAADKLLIYTTAGERVDELSGFTLPVSQIRRIGVIEETGQVAIQELDVYATVEGLVWDPLPDGARVKWSNAESLSDAQRQAVLPFSRPTVSLEHVLVDAHSGRLFGRAGAYLINAVGIASMLLSVTGVWMMWRTRRRRPAPKKGR